MNITLNGLSSLSFYIYILLFRVVLDISYLVIISNLFSYQGFQNKFSLFFEFSSLFVLGLFSIAFYKIYINAENKISNVILLVMFLMSFVPFTSMFGFGMFQLNFIVANIVFWCCLLLFSTIPLKNIPVKWTYSIVFKFGKRVLLSETGIKILSLFFGLLVLYISGVYGGFRLNFNLENVYELRAEAKNFDLPVLIRYAFSWTRTVNAIFIAYYMQKRNWGWAILCFGIQMLNFGVDGSKTTFFLAIFAVAINVVPKFSLQRLNKWIVLGFLGLTFFCTTFYILFSNSLSISIWPVSLFVRRVMYLPIYISSNYFDFFTTFEPDYYRQSFLRLIGFVSPYSNIPYMIGEKYFGEVTAANNGLLSDAVTNMGLVGIIIVSSFYALIFRILNKVSEGLDAKIHLTVAMYIAVVLVNTFLFTVLLTHGLLITMLILYLISRDTII